MKTLLLYIFFFIGILTYGQFTVTNHATDETVNDGEVFTFTEYGNDGDSDLSLIVTNNTSSSISLYLEATELVNTEGTQFEHCFDACRWGITANNPYGPLSLDANASTMVGAVHFKNYDEGIDTSADVDYVLRIYQLDDQNNEVASVSFTYRYSPTTGINTQFSKEELQLSYMPGIIKINNKYPATIGIFNLTGQKVKEVIFSEGTHQINTGDFTKGIYIIRAESHQKEMYQKIIIN